ncbi:DUF4843 domain-containing protein [Sphingobacterium yanglingense]|jgi:hypothetical protein|uniref:Uncharacterized protein DUF4843 n=1 Tax=Sphingobacterium yanglingense TaxID=1437280 RepID=A0A4R6WPF6_9SPHI|nr:DUF4843 domain-containing protein [Sphingobacterium yanglingense]TDQ78125.1 uncharacterized protein DUF4843 [Sphingobacterium yanglingense]
MEKYYFIVIALIFFFSCKKNDQAPFFDANTSISISGDKQQGTKADSLVYSFAVQPSSLQETNIKIHVRTVGNIVDSDREFSLVINPTLTTAEDAEFEFPKVFTMPANASTTTINVKIKRSERLKATNAKLVIDVAENKEFKPAPIFKSLTDPYQTNRFSIVWTDVLTKPAEWDDGVYFLYMFGEWSKTKHQLIIDATGRASYTDLVPFEEEWYAILAKSSAWLAEYNAAHPDDPLVDEHGDIVEFYF